MRTPPAIWKHLNWPNYFRVLSMEETEHLLNQPDSETVLGLRDKAMLELIYATGLRVSELVNLNVQDINMEMGFCAVSEKGQRKGLFPLVLIQ